MWKSLFHVERSIAGSTEEDAGLGGRDRDGLLKGEAGGWGGWGSRQKEKIVPGTGSCGG